MQQAETELISDEEFEGIKTEKVLVAVRIKSINKILLTTNGRKSERKRLAMNSFGKGRYLISENWNLTTKKGVTAFKDGMLL